IRDFGWAHSGAGPADLDAGRIARLEARRGCPGRDAWKRRGRRGASSGRASGAGRPPADHRARAQAVGAPPVLRRPGTLPAPGPATMVRTCTTADPGNVAGGSPETGSACDLSSCKIEVAVYFSSVQKSVPVAYVVKFFDRCTGQTTDLPGPTTTTPASGYIVA